MKWIKDLVSPTTRAWEDYQHWVSTDRAMLRRLNRLIDETLHDPFRGPGRPEQLRHVLAGAWSRRIDQEHRVVYRIDGEDLVILQARYHYR